MEVIKKWELQLFAAGDVAGTDGNGTEPAEPNKEGDNGGEQSNSFDDFLKDPNHQAEFDRRIEKAIKTRESKLEDKYKEDLKKAQTEAEKLAKMNAEQKKDYELEQMREENARLRAESELNAMRSTASSLLNEKGIEANSDMLDLVVEGDAEKTKANIEKLVSIVEKELKAAEVKRATGRTPNNFNNNSGNLSPIEEKIAKYKKP
jgi:hypothetical protein